MSLLNGEIHQKLWGEERWIINSEKYCGKILSLKKGYRCSLHYHKLKDEVFYVMSGKVFMEVGDFAKILYPGDAVHVVPLNLHRFSGIEDATIFECSSTHFEEDSYRKEPSGEIPPLF
jgi:mannose-6-phosphate isomerase-like protein (cupin superfamily)